MKQQRRILIVDDEQHMRTSLQVIIRKLGHYPECAKNGSEAFEMLLEHILNNASFDLILCDLQMPVMTGEDLIRKMKKRKINTPVLVITGVGDKDSVVRLMRLGCRDFIDKPFSPNEIETRIMALLNEMSTEVKENSRKEFYVRIGERARATAHDINNVVGVTLGYADLALEVIGKQDHLREQLNKIHSSANRVADICRDLLMFKPENAVSAKLMTDMNLIVERVAEILRDVVPDYISIITNNHKTPIWIEADVWQMQHVLLNLGFNAADAMTSKGEIRFEIDFDAQSDRNIHIKVEDTGCGIHPEILPHIFETGYSTKSKGFGFGLSNIQKIIMQHNGTIKVVSTVNCGTCFTILLPYTKR